MKPQKPEPADPIERGDASPLDRPLSPIYLGVVIIEAIIILLLVILGRTFS